MIAAVIPLKRLSDAKSRLAGELSASERRQLVVELAERTAMLLRESGLIGSIAVVTAEPELGVRLGVHSLPDSGDLNASLAGGAAWAGRQGAHGLLILPGDLPLLQRNDLHALLSLRARGVAIAATPDGGTGALYLTPPDAIAPSFGEGSFRRHVERARARGIAVRQVQRDGLSLDLDTAGDLARWRRWGRLPVGGLS